MLLPIATAAMLLLLKAMASQTSVDDRCQLEAARLYVQAVASRNTADAASVPLDEHVHRYEHLGAVVWPRERNAADLRHGLSQGIADTFTDGLVPGKPVSYTPFAAGARLPTTAKAGIEAVFTLKGRLKLGSSNSITEHEDEAHLPSTFPLGEIPVRVDLVFAQNDACAISRIDIYDFEQ